MTQKPVPETEPGQRHRELALLLTRAEKGDLSILPELRKALDANASIWQRCGDLAIQAEASLVKLAALPSLLFAESLVR
jgi:hypothetical protein